VSSKARRRRRELETGRPSAFFIIALTAGVMFLLWIAIQVIRRPMTPPKYDENAAVVKHYLSAKTLDDALSALAPDYHLWFGKREGAGMDRASVAKMLEWDFALAPRHRIDRIDVSGDTVTVQVHEDNDFSLLIGFPGWDATSTYIIDAQHHIASQLYVPREGQPEWRPYLDKPLAWITEHHPDALPRIFPNGKLAQTRASALEWVSLLGQWRKATGQSDPTSAPS
jgi:hypothetical protein